MQTIIEHGALGLFRGMAAPFATVAVYNAFIFAARGQMEKVLNHADGELNALEHINTAFRVKNRQFTSLHVDISHVRGLSQQTLLRDSLQAVR